LIVAGRTPRVPWITATAYSG